MDPSESGSSGSETVAVRPGVLAANLRTDAVDLVVPGTRVGRYSISEQIGAGGMGVVLRAHDPELDRDVALKRIRSDRASEAAQRRLVREAQAMARLNHPNVVPVYGVEQGPDGIYIAMQLVQGVSLSQWLRMQPRTLAEILDAFAAAGRGLGAAHDVGLVHRDFKPGNVLVGDDGIVRVMDFGLARSEGESDEEDGSSSVDEEITAAGTVMGTPAYMAPEQHAGHADARSDQYAFCVALWEALCGQRPFRGRDLRTAKLAGPPSSVPRRGLSPAIAQALVRGLDPRPDARWPSMAELLDALDRGRDRGTRRRRTIFAGVALGAVVVVGIGLARSLPEAPGRCAANGELVGVWDPATRERFDALPSDASLAMARARLDTWADAFARAHREACEAADVDGDSKAIDQQLACLRRHRSEVRAHVELMLTGADDILARAGRLTEDLPSIAECTTPDASPVPAITDEAELAWLDRVAALMTAARYGEARKEIDARLPELVNASTPLAREVFGHDCYLLTNESRFDDALERCRRAYEEFAAAREDVRAIEIGSELIKILGHHMGRYAEAEHWVGQVEALTERSGRGSRAEAAFLVELGTLRSEQGRLEEGVRALEDAVRVRRELESSSRLGLARTEGMLGMTLAEAGRLDEAERHLEESLEIIEADAGKMHPDVAVVHNLLGNVADGRGDLDGASSHYQRALEVVRAAHGDADERVGFLLNNLGRVADKRGQTDEARRLYSEGKAIKEKVLGPDHPSVGTSENNLGLVALHSGDLETAERHFVRAVEIFRVVHGDGHPDVLQAKANTARALLEQGRLEQAAAEVGTALAAAARLPDEPPILVYAHAVHGDALVRLGRFDDAVVSLERAVALGERGEGSVQDRAAAQFLLARALEGSDLERARAEAAEARRLLQAEAKDLGGASGGAERLLAEIDAWQARVSASARARRPRSRRR